jgi:hypothetical protein
MIGVKRWEYVDLIIEEGDRDQFEVLMDDLRRLGDNGWELACLVPHPVEIRVVLKRPAQQRLM